jgi:acyl-CoA reductase-like NAD-dependent aldehyde dehydrogenase
VAAAARPAWRELAAEDRGRLLVKIIDLIDVNFDCLAHAEG